MQRHEPGPPMDLANMREQGVKSLGHKTDLHDGRSLMRKLLIAAILAMGSCAARADSVPK
jgi:hypothetical protein